MLSKRVQEILDAPEPVYVRGRMSGGGKVLIILNVVNFLLGCASIVAFIYAVAANIKGAEPEAFSVAAGLGYATTVGIVWGVILCFVTARERRLRVARFVAGVWAMVVFIVWVWVCGI